MEENKHNYVPHPFELFGIECHKGWYDLLTPVFEYVENYNKDKKDEEQIKFLQIKEKWGGLNIYTNFGNDELFKLIDKAEEESYNVCEECGSRNDVGMRESGWMTTMCLECIKKEVKERDYPQTWKRNLDNKLYFIQSDGTMEEIEL